MRLALSVIAVMGALYVLGRSVQGRTAIAPAPIPDDEYVPMAAWPMSSAGTYTVRCTCGSSVATVCLVHAVSWNYTGSN